MALNLDDLLVDESKRNLTDLPDTGAALDAEYAQGERQYRKSLTDVSKNLSSEAIRRNVYTQGGELDKGVQRAFDEVYATPLGEFTRGLAIDAAKQRFANRQTAIQIGQGVSTAQEGARQSRRSLAETGRQFDVQQSGVMSDAPQVDAGGNWVGPEPPLEPMDGGEPRASMAKPVAQPTAGKFRRPKQDGTPGYEYAETLESGNFVGWENNPDFKAQPSPVAQPKPRLTLAGARQSAEISTQQAQTFGGGYVDEIGADGAPTGKKVWKATEQRRQFDVDAMLKTAAAQGKSIALNADGTLKIGLDGKPEMVDSLDAKRLQLQTTETMGGYMDPDTKQWVSTLQGKAVTQDIASKKAADQRAWIEMYGGGEAPVTFTADEWQAAPIGAKQGDQNYDARWDQDGDGEVTVQDAVDIGGNSKDNGDGTFSYTNPKAAASGPRTLEGQKLDVQSRELSGRLGLDLKKFKEGQDQFTRTMKFDKQKWITDVSGYVYDENMQPVGMKNPDGTTRPMTTLERDKFTEMQNEFNANFDEAQYKFDITTGLDQRQIDATDRQATNLANMTMWLGLGQIGADVLDSDAAKKAGGWIKKGLGWIWDKATGGGDDGKDDVPYPGTSMKPAVGGLGKVEDDVDALLKSIGLQADGQLLFDPSAQVAAASDETLSAAIAGMALGAEKWGADKYPLLAILNAEAERRATGAKASARTSASGSVSASGNPLELRPDYRARPGSRSSMVTAPGQPYNFATQQPNLPGFDPKLSPPPRPPVAPVKAPAVQPPGPGTLQPPQPPVKTPEFPAETPQEKADREAREAADDRARIAADNDRKYREAEEAGTAAPIPQRPTYVKNGRIYDDTGQDLGPAPSPTIVQTTKNRSGLDRPGELTPDLGTGIVDQGGGMEVMISGGITYQRTNGGQWTPWTGKDVGGGIRPPPPGQLPGGPQPIELPPGASNAGGTNPLVPEAGGKFYPSASTTIPTAVRASLATPPPPKFTPAMVQYLDSARIDEQGVPGLRAEFERYLAGIGVLDPGSQNMNWYFGQFMNSLQQRQDAPGQTFSAAPAGPAPEAPPAARAGLATPAPHAALSDAQPGQISRQNGAFKMADGSAGRVDGMDNVLDGSGQAIGRLQRDQDGQITGFLLNTGQFVPMSQTWASI